MKKQKNKIKKEKILVNFILLIFVISFLSLVSAQESCYVRININETLITNVTGDAIGVSNTFDSQENLYGDYFRSVQEYNNETSSNYLLKTYDFSNNFLNAYSINTGLLVYYDNFDDSGSFGSVELLNESQTSTIIPYNSSIYRITIEFSDRGEQNLGGFDSSLLSCERTCLITGETGIYDNDRCCQGYAEISSDGTSLSCIKTNDGFCDSDFGENKYNSFKDCFNISSYSCKQGFVKNMFGGCSNETLSYCGDGLVHPSLGEECDDENNLTGDGCSKECKIEGVSECFENEGSVLFANVSYQNTCDSNNFITYSCHLNIFTFNFRELFRYSLDQDIQTCEYGCSGSSCLSKPVSSNQSINYTEKGGSCNKIGYRTSVSEWLFYCDISGYYMRVKPDFANCDNNFECLNNLCSAGKCVNLYAEAKNNKNLAENVDTNANN